MSVYASIGLLTNWFTGLNSLVKLLVINFSIQWSGFLVANLFKTEIFYDLFGASTFLTLSILNYKWKNTGHPREYIQTACISIWALRLGLYLFTRILKSGRDRRFDAIKPNAVRFWVAWTLQGVWVIVTLLPSLLCVGNLRPRELGWREYSGWGLWVTGFLIETVADYQKSSFRNNPANEGKFITTGLWAFSRHPNYFGEVLLWFGLYVSASSSFHYWQYLTVLCPILDYILITKVSGIPPLEKYGIKKWGTVPKYQEYFRRTPILVPFWY